MPKVTEFNRLSGDIDYTLNMMVRSVSDFGHIFNASSAKSVSQLSQPASQWRQLNSQGSYRWSGMDS